METIDQFITDDVLVEAVLRLNTPKQFQAALDNSHLQSLYENYANHLRTRFFSGNQLRFQVRMAACFGAYQTGQQTVDAQTLQGACRQMLASIKRRKRYAPHEDHHLLIGQYNGLVARYNEAIAGHKKLAKLYRKLQKQAAPSPAK